MRCTVQVDSALAVCSFRFFKYSLHLLRFSVHVASFNNQPYRQLMARGEVAQEQSWPPVVRCGTLSVLT
jgi:hypothetical protein